MQIIYKAIEELIPLDKIKINGVEVSWSEYIDKVLGGSI